MADPSPLTTSMLLMLSGREQPQFKGFATDDLVNLHAVGIFTTRVYYPKLRSGSEAFLRVVDLD